MSELPDVSTLAIGAALAALVVVAWQLQRRKKQRAREAQLRHRDDLRNQ